MANLIINILYVLLALVSMVSLDLLFFKKQFLNKEQPWKLLMLNIGIVFVFLAFYFLVLDSVGNS
jgi:hypothetical protein